METPENNVDRVWLKFHLKRFPANELDLVCLIWEVKERQLVYNAAFNLVVESEDDVDPVIVSCIPNLPLRQKDHVACLSNIEEGSLSDFKESPEFKQAEGILSVVMDRQILDVAERPRNADRQLLLPDLVVFLGSAL